MSDRVQGATRKLLLGMLRQASALLAVSDLSTGQPCQDCEHELDMWVDLIESGHLQLTLRNGLGIGTGDGAATSVSLQRLRERFTR